MIFENQDAPADEELDLLHQHTPLNPYINAACNRCLLGMGLGLKDANGRRVDAETQVAVWCTAYFNWMRKHRKGNARLPPLVACVMIGHLFDFYIAYAIEDPQDFRVVCPITVDRLCQRYLYYLGYVGSAA